MFVFWILLFSGMLTHLARGESAHEKRPGLKTLVGYIAMTNGLGILVSSTVQFTCAYDNVRNSLVYSGSVVMKVSGCP